MNVERKSSYKKEVDNKLMKLVNFLIEQHNLKIVNAHDERMG